MIYSTKVTQKGQATIPKKLRDKYNISADKPLYIEDRGNELVIRKTADFLDLQGSVKSIVPKTDQDWNNDVLAHVSKQYAKKNSRP